MFISEISFIFKRFLSNTKKKPIFAAKKIQKANKQEQDLTSSIKNQMSQFDYKQQDSVKSITDIDSLKSFQSQIFHQKRDQLANYLYTISQLISSQQYEKHKTFLEQITYKARKTSSQLTLTTQQLLKILIFMQQMQKFDKNQKKTGGFQVRMSTLAAQIILDKNLKVSEAITLYCLLDSLGYKTLQVVQNLAAYLKNQLKYNTLTMELFISILAIYSEKSIKTVIENILTDQVVNSMKIDVLKNCKIVTLHIQNIRLLSELQVWRFYKTDSKKVVKLIQVSLSKVKNFIKQKTVQLNYKQLFILKQIINKLNGSYKFHEEIIRDCKEIQTQYRKFITRNLQESNPNVKITKIEQQEIKYHLSKPQKLIKVLLQRYKQLGNYQLLLNFIQSNSQVWFSIKNNTNKQLVLEMQKQLILFYFLLSFSSIQQIYTSSKNFLINLPFSQHSIYQFLNYIPQKKLFENKSLLFSFISKRSQRLSSCLMDLPTNDKFFYQKWQVFIFYYLKQSKQVKLKSVQLLKKFFLKALEGQNARKVILITYFTNLLADRQIEGQKKQLKAFVVQILNQTLNTSKAFHYHCYMKIVTNLLSSDLLSLKMFQSIIKLGKQVSMKQLYDNCLLVILFGMYTRINMYKTMFLDENSINKQHNFILRGLKILNFQTDSIEKTQQQTTNMTASYLSAVFMSGTKDIQYRSCQISDFIEKCKSYSDFSLLLNSYQMSKYKHFMLQQKAKLSQINKAFIKKIDEFSRQERYKQALQNYRGKLYKADIQYKNQ